MDLNSDARIMSQNNSSSEPARAQLDVISETVTFHRVAPPPYSLLDYAAPNQTIIYQTVVTQPPLKDRPTYYNCLKCGTRVLTKVKYSNTQKTHVLAGFICGLTLFCALCCLGALPYMTKQFKQAEHFCPLCTTLLGSYSRI